MNVPLYRFIVVEQGLIPGIFSGLINGGIAAWIHWGGGSMPLGGGSGVGVDFLATAFLLALITCLIVSPLVIGKIKKGKVVVVKPCQLSAAWLPVQSVFGRGLLLGLLALCVTLPMLFIFSLIGVNSFTLIEFLVVKTIFTGVLGGSATALSAWWSLVGHLRAVKATVSAS